MNRILKCTILSLVTIVFFSCKDDGCVTCEKQLVNTKTTQEICPSGADIDVRITLIGIGSDSLIKNTTVSAYQSLLQAAGYTCK
jgi:hypothetical protein